MSDFYDRMIASFPASLQPPEALRRYFRWVSDQGLGRVGRNEYHYGLIDPSQEDSCLGLVPVDPDHARYWMDQTDPEIIGRLAPFCRTGGDGSYAALWRDDNGQMKIVHLGSGSGSVMVGVMADDPVDFLRLLAIGYDELCWPENHDKTPAEVFADQYDDEEEVDGQPRVLPAPEALRAWLASEFGTSVPGTAAEILGRLPGMDDDTSDDPFWQWLKKVQGW
jgi:hypothetical protein